jgi:hypothetical protein
MDARELYRALFAEVSPRLEHWRTDLTKHDRRWLKRNPGVPFLHYTRETGTDLVALHAADDAYWPAEGEQIPYLFATADRWHILKQVAVIIDYEAQTMAREGDRLILHYDGRKLRRIDNPKAREIGRDYTRAIESDWKPSRQEIERRALDFLRVS